MQDRNYFKFEFVEDLFPEYEVPDVVDTNCNMDFVSQCHRRSQEFVFGGILGYGLIEVFVYLCVASVLGLF